MHVFPLRPASSYTTPSPLHSLLTFGIDPLRIQIRQDGLITLLLKALGRLLVHQTATPSPPPVLLELFVCAHLLGGLHIQVRRRIHLVGKGDAAALQEGVGRQFGGGGGGGGGGNVVVGGARSIGLRMRVGG